jgi:saccharopine dehydrogenase (NAD+, L-lysine-forming)
MKVAVLGGAGLTGRCAVRALAESPEVSDVLVADVNLEGAKTIVEQIGVSKLQAAHANVIDPELTAKLLRGYDVVINAVQYYFNLDAMNAALKAHVNYLDFGGLYHTTLKQLKMDEAFRSNGLTAILGMGAQPGITNVIARYAADQMDTVNSVEIRDGYTDLTPGVGSFVVTWSLDTFLDELMLDAVIFEDGKLKTIPALSRKESVDFPEPVGRLDTYVTLHSEPATLPMSLGSKGIRKVDWMEGGPGIFAVKLLVDIGLGSNVETVVGGIKVTPRRFLLDLIRSKGLIGHPKHLTPNDLEITRVTVTGKKSGRNVKQQYDVLIPAKKEWRLSCSQYGVGIPGSIAARMIGNGQVTERGVVAPENCIDPGIFIKELDRYGIKLASTTPTEKPRPKRKAIHRRR